MTLLLRTWSSIDLSLIRSAMKSVDIAVDPLTDWAIIAALKEARARWRYHSHRTRSKCSPSRTIKPLDIAEVVRVKKRGALMHLKSLRGRWRPASHRFREPQSETAG